MALVPPDLLLNLMVVYFSLTGLLGFIANGAAIFLFARTSKVRKGFMEKVKKDGKCEEKITTVIPAKKMEKKEAMKYIE